MNTINLQAIADELEFDLEDVEMLYEVFLADATESLKALKSAVANSDYEAIFTNAHAIKGSAGNILLRDIQQAAQAMEEPARAGVDAPYQELYEKLSTLVAQE